MNWLLRLTNKSYRHHKGMIKRRWEIKEMTENGVMPVTIRHILRNIKVERNHTRICQ